MGPGTGKTNRDRFSLVSVNKVVQSSIDLLRAQFHSYGIELGTDLSENLPPVMANPYSLEEVLLNLMSNARDTVEDRMQDADFSDARVRLCTKRNRKGIQIAVVDNGRGIPDGILPRVFDPFFTTKDPDKGTGLGLAICRSIVEELGGHLSIQSTPGEGTEVTITLPIQKNR